ncbi:hypothetical protein KC960_03045 [Candidatus Saccharibacteria bacterium]|nr:hypothetical protein [Candidatus Saccharibacteria bacterium]
MPYRSTRFEVGELRGLGQVYDQIDRLVSNGQATIQDEIMAGRSFRRPLDQETIDSGIDANYVLQTVLALPPPPEGKRLSMRPFLEKANKVLGSLTLPGEVSVDHGGMYGFDETNTSYAFGSSGYDELDDTFVYPPWLRADWEEAGKSLIFFCGIQVPKIRRRLYDHDRSGWSTRFMRRGFVVFSPTPQNLVNQ